MSAILGVFRLDGLPVRREDMQPMMESVAQYGREGSGLWLDGPVGLGHCITRLVPESFCEQRPLVRNGLTITADVRIDNRDEIFDKLNLSDSERSFVSDDELVLRAYQRWGENCPTYLIGDYSFAVWDRDAGRLFCARDHIGARPFYYCYTDRLFVLATDIRAVLAFPGVAARIDESEVARMLLWELPGYYDPERTFFEDIGKLPFGHWLSVNRQGKQLTRYWTPEAIPPLRLPRAEDYAARLRQLVRQAVADRLRSSGRVGVHLSGGLDSSSIAVTAAQVLRERGSPAPIAFSWSPPPVDDSMPGEHRWIEAVCRLEGLECLYNEMTDDEWIPLNDEDPATRPRNTFGIERHVQRRAAGRGVRVILSGWGGDEAASFNGRGMLAEYLKTGRWGEMLSYFRSRVTFRQPRSLVRALRQLWRDGVSPLLVEQRLLSPSRACPRIPAYVRSDFLKRVGSRVRPQPFFLRSGIGPRQWQWRLYHSGLVTARIESWVSFGADYDVVYAYPLLDRRVLEFIYAIPVELHNGEKQGRALFRLAMTPLLPRDMPQQDVKAEVILAQHRQKRLRPSGFVELLADAADLNNPWVDVGKLKREPTPRSRGKSKRWKAILRGHAMLAVVLWRRWSKTRSTGSDIADILRPS